MFFLIFILNWESGELVFKGDICGDFGRFWLTGCVPLILHVPMVANSNLLNLYKFLPLPIHFDLAANISITPNVGQTNLLAIGHSQSFQANSSTDLHACLGRCHLQGSHMVKGGLWRLVFQVAWIFSLILFCKVLEVSNVPEVRVYHLELREWRARLQGWYLWWLR